MNQARDDPARDVLSALTRLMAYWSSPAVQDRISAPIGLGLTSSEVSILYLLGVHGGSCRPSELAAEAHLSRPTASKAITRLEASGLVTRRPDPDDGRAHQLILTESGRVDVDGLVRAGVDLVADAIADWPRADRDALADLVPRLVAALVGPTRLPPAPVGGEARPPG